MNESARTITYVVVAVVAVALALVMNPPREITPESLTKANVGKEFYPDFKPDEATSIRVVGFDEAKAEKRIFGVKLENGKWTIPTRHNYPADGADRLAKTATSVRRIKREELASSSVEDQELLGVVDPLDKDVTKLKGRGQRITLNKGDTPLVDLIIGKQLKERPGYFYIRKPDEQATYVAKISIDLSTKFADWVETDLLKLDKNDLTEIVINNYKAETDGNRLGIVPGENSTLTHEKPADPWKLAGLEEGEELDVAKVNAMTATLDDLKLAGVRPKPKGLKADLTIDPDFDNRPEASQLLAMEMQARGFFLARDPETRRRRLYADEGELTAATNKGVVYTLKFGSVFLGDETEIEVGAAADKDKTDAQPNDEEAADDKSKTKANEGKQSSRYLFVTADFDEKFLGQPPQKPAPPEEIAATAEPAAKPKKKPLPKQSVDKKNGEQKSPTDAPATPEEKAVDNKPDDQSAKDQAPKDQSGKPDDRDENCFPVSATADDADLTGEPKAEKSAEEPDGKKPDADENADDKPDADKKAPEKKAADEKPDVSAPATEEKSQPAPKEEKKKSADELKKEYDAQVKKYESDLKAHQDKVAAGKKQVEELNARFGAWYYVISAENFNKLHVARKELVKAKAKSADDKKGDQNPEQMEEENDEPVKDPLKSLDEKDENDAKKPE